MFGEDERDDATTKRLRDQTSNATEAIMRRTDLKYAARLHSRGWRLVPPPHVVEETPDSVRFMPD